MPALRTAAIPTLVGSIAVLALAVTGCSSTSSGSGGASSAGKVPSTTASATVAAVTTPAGSGATTSDTTAAPKPAPQSAPRRLQGVPKACPSADEVMARLHLSALVLAGADPSFCQYLFHGAKSEPHLVITFNAAAGLTTTSFEAGLKQAQKQVKAVPGLGDAAFTFAGAAGSTGLSTLSGSTVFSMLPTVPTSTTDEIDLAKAIIAG